MAQVMLFSALDARKIFLLSSATQPERNVSAEWSSNSLNTQRETGALKKR
jgi:hypothetical protein